MYDSKEGLDQNDIKYELDNEDYHSNVCIRVNYG